MTHILLHVPMMIISTLNRLAAADYGVYQRYPREIFTKMLLFNKIFVISNSFHGLISFWHRKVRARAGGGVPGEARPPHYEQQKKWDEFRFLGNCPPNPSTKPTFCAK